MRKVWIATTEPCPNGMAATARILGYADGFCKNGVEVKIFVTYPTEYPGNEANASCSRFQGVEITYLAGAKKSASGWGRKWQYLRGLWAFIKLMCGKEPPQAILYYSPQMLLLFVISIIAGFRNIQIWKEENEHPTVRLKEMRWWQKMLFPFFFYRPADRLLLITRYLVEFFGKDGWKKETLVHVPMFVNENRFHARKAAGNPEKYFVYCGCMSSRKDGVNYLLDAFERFHRKHGECRLVLIGEGSDLQEYRAWVNERNLGNDIRFPGKLPQEQVPDLITGACAAVLPRPVSLQATAGFPTKLGEYLISGTPVIVTAVGEIPDYLTDRENACVVKPGDSDALYESMIYLYESPEDAERIGNNGIAVAHRCFDTMKNTRELVELLA